ncbi:FAD-dependent oxidoreductase [Nocardiopsis flavescens]|uniref:FAD-dependent oxidoreductase n=1 Tax=Nocardiopsis flavescens TaxID=758803 RepID=UPI00366003B0
MGWSAHEGTMERLRPRLDFARFDRLRSYGVEQEVAAGDVLTRSGDFERDLVVLDEAHVEIVREASFDRPEEVVMTMGPGDFLGEVNLLGNYMAFVTVRVVAPGRVHRLSKDRFRTMMAEEVELSDIVLEALLVRREYLHEVVRPVDVVGHHMSSATLALRTYAARVRLPYAWHDADSPDGRRLLDTVGLRGDDLPAVVFAGQVTRNVTPGILAERIGKAYRPSCKDVDLVVVGAGPAGLAAGLYGASEGLNTVVLDALGTGGQAASSSRIENYPGFPHGIAGEELTRLSSIQALKFGAEMYMPCRVERLDTTGPDPVLYLADGSRIDTRAVVVASGARYRTLPLEGWADFEESGCIFYAATELEVRSCSRHPVTVVGGANSAGQAALYLAGRGSRVDLVVRGPDLSAKMSEYLVARLHDHPDVTVHTGTEVTGLKGDRKLAEVVLTDRRTGREAARPTSGLFCFIGASPATGWLDGVTRDRSGFVCTDSALAEPGLGPVWEKLGRGPLPFETSAPSVFAVGDTRTGSIKRVAAAMGEGASAIASVHAALAERRHRAV